MRHLFFSLMITTLLFVVTTIAYPTRTASTKPEKSDASSTPSSGGAQPSLVNTDSETGEPLNPVDVTPPWLNFSPHDVHVEGNYAYVACNAGLHIIDIERPESAYIVKTMESDGAEAVRVCGGYAYILCDDEGDYWIDIIDIEPLESAYVVKTVYPLPGTPTGFHISDGYAYVACIGDNGLHIIDVHPAIVPIDPPVAAHIVKTVVLDDAQDVHVSGGYAYVSSFSGLHIINIDPPESAYIMKTVDTPGSALGVYVSGEYAYVADGFAGLTIIDIEPISSAYIVKTVDNQVSTQNANADIEYQSVHVSGKYAYVTGEEYVMDDDGLLRSTGYGVGVQIIDIEPPESAYIVKTIDTLGRANSVQVSGGYAYVADGDGGLRIIKLW